MGVFPRAGWSWAPEGGSGGSAGQVCAGSSSAALCSLVLVSHHGETATISSQPTLLGVLPLSRTHRNPKIPTRISPMGSNSSVAVGAAHQEFWGEL